METKDVQFERLGDANKTYPESTIIIRKQFFDGIVARFQDTIRTRTEKLVEEQKIRVELAENFQKEYHKNFELQEQIRKQKYWRCLARAKNAEKMAINFNQLFYETNVSKLEKPYLNQMEIYYKWQKLWLKLAERYKQPLEYIEKDLK